MALGLKQRCQLERTEYASDGTPSVRTDQEYEDAVRDTLNAYIDYYKTVKGLTDTEYDTDVVITGSDLPFDEKHTMDGDDIIISHVMTSEHQEVCLFYEDV